MGGSCALLRLVLSASPQSQHEQLPCAAEGLKCMWMIVTVDVADMMCSCMAARTSDGDRVLSFTALCEQIQQMNIWGLRSSCPTIV